MKGIIKILLVISLLVWTKSAHATHNRAGEITYRQIGPLTIEMTITTYTKNSSVAADRDSLELFWGDGSSQFVKRDNSKTRIEPNDIKVNFYIAQHTYPGVATYTISFLDPNRIGGILNVNYPNSIDIPFFLTTTFTLLDQQFQGFNNSAVLLQPPIDIGCVNKLFIHNPNAFDPDGDSLAYEITAPLQAINTPVSGYKLPDEIGASIGNTLTINPVTGEVRWNSPKLQGEYNIAILIKEYRNGRLINVIFRDMQILIKACDNEPPTIDVEEELCVIAGERIVLPIKVGDPNQNQKVKLFATGGPLEGDSPAALVAPIYFTSVPFEASLVWQTNCNHISKQYYQIVIRAVDNFYPDSTGLATLKTIRIKIIGPPPENLIANSLDNKIKLEWDSPYDCEITDNNYFRGFSVWRKLASTNYMPDTCNPGLSASPYTRIAINRKLIENGKYTYEDTSIVTGQTYCYRVQADFSKLTLSNNPFNRVESLPSDETCLVLNRDVPLITKVSVISTDVSNGTIHIRFTKPIADQLDTIINPSPYRYQISRSSDNLNYQIITTINSPFFNSDIDTNFIDNNLNTTEIQYYYKIDFFSNNNIYNNSPIASSLFLTVSPTDKINNLTWQSQTPWSNQLYRVYKKDDLGIFQLIDSTATNTYQDRNLINDSLYCYKIESIGTFSIDNIEDPIINFSQEACQRPFDNVPPCSPTIIVKNICETQNIDFNQENLYNTIQWSSPISNCPNMLDDIETYNIYYAETEEATLTLIDTKDNTFPLEYLHSPDKGILGCYAVSSVDAQNNESPLSNIICVDNCPIFILPNTFTPNQDGKNDFFKPRLNVFVESIDFKVYNQWGNLVFETTDPQINWDGNTSSGTPLADGTYHYICKVFENRVSGIVAREEFLSGFILILRN